MSKHGNKGRRNSDDDFNENHRARDRSKHRAAKSRKGEDGRSRRRNEESITPPLPPKSSDDEESDMDDGARGLEPSQFEKIMQAINSASAQQAQQHAALARQFDEHTNNVTNRFANVDHKLEEVNTKVENVEGSVTDLGQRVAALELAPMQHEPVQAAWGPPPSNISQSSFPLDTPIPTVSQGQGNWQRIPDPAILRISVADRIKVSLDEITKQIKTYGDLLGIPDNAYEVTGRDLGSSFAIECGGLTPNSVAKDFLKGLKLHNANDDDVDPSSRWRKLTCESPNQAQARFYINPDKNGKTAKTEGCTKRLFLRLKAKYPEHKFYARRSEGIIDLNFKQLAVLDVGEDEVKVSWSNKQLLPKNPRGIEYKDIHYAFLEDENVQWCS